MRQSPDISFVVVNYNGIHHTRELLNSMRCNLDSLPVEVIVVDNGSLVNEAELLSTEFPEHRFIRSEENLGFSGGNNLGIKASSGDYIMLLNNDTILPDSSVRELVKTLKSNPEIGVVSPKIHFMNPPGTIQYAGFTELTRITLRNRAIGYNEPDKGQHDIPSRTAYAHGAAMMIKREVIEKAGLMPEIFFLYYEELDWCTKIRDIGYEIWYQPASLVIHKESQSVGQGSYIRSYYMTRNRLLYVLRNRKGFERVLAIIYQMTVSTPTGIIRSVMNGRFDLARAYLSGTIDIVTLRNKFLHTWK